MANGFFGNFLDKFKLADEKMEDRIHSNQIATDYDDGAIELDDAYSQYLLNIDWSYNSQAELIETYRDVANYSTVDYAIEDVVNEMVSFSEHEDAIKLDLSALTEDLSENIRKKIHEKYDKIFRILELNNTIHKRSRQFYIDGRLTYQKVIDQKKPGDGLLDVIELDSRFISKIRNKEYNTDTKTIEKITEYFIYDENITTARNQGKNNKPGSNNNKQFKEALRIDPKSLTHVTSGITDLNTGMAISWLHKAVSPANQLRMMENALVIYRITRAPERRIFYVDTANLPKSKAESYIRNLKNMYRNKMSFDPETGTFKDRKHLQTMQEDYWLPRNSNGKGTEVSTLPGGCFAMDTKVSLLDGREMSIADVRDEMNEGKELWTYSAHPETGKVVPGLISWAGVTQESAEVMKLTLDNGEEIVCTPDHKFPVYGKGFVRADQLNHNESMIPLYRKKEHISDHKKLDYEQYFDNEDKTWKFTHRSVADYLKDDNMINQLNKTNEHKRDYNRDPEVGFYENNVKKIPLQFGYDSWKDFRVKESVHNHRIVKIEKLDERIQVGTLTIDQDEIYHDYHTFALTAGIFTKNSNLSEIDDVIYFQKQLYKALNLPVTRLEPESSMMGGRGAEVSRDELKFSKFVSKIRKRFNLALLDLMKTELILTKVMTVQEWNDIASKINFIYAQDMQLDEIRKAELERERLDLLQLYQPYIGRYVSHRYMRENVLKQTENEITEMDKEIEEEKNNPLYQPPEEGGL
jgi:hypothetical protein